MLKETDCVATRLLYTMGVNIQKLYVAVLTAMGIENPTAEELQGGRNQKTQKSGAATPTLDQYSRDLTVMAAEGKLDPVGFYWKICPQLRLTAHTPKTLINAGYIRAVRTNRAGIIP